MNRARVAALLRELADEFDSEDETVAPPAPKSKPRRRRTMTRPAGEADPAVAGQAARILRDRGFR